MKLRLPSLKEKPQTKQEKKKKKRTTPIEVDDIEIGEEVFDDAPEFTDIGKLDYSYEPIKVEHESKFQRINQVSQPTVRLPKQKKKKQTSPKRKISAEEEARNLMREYSDDTDVEVLDDKERARRMKERAALRRKTERFITIRMWISTIMSHFFSDRNKIPKNIGNRILISNNSYVTKNHLSKMIIVNEMSEYTPIMWMSDLVEYTKNKAHGCIVNITIKNFPYRIDMKQSGMSSRVRSWTFQIENDATSNEIRRRASRCLYTVEVAKNKTEHLYKGYTYITIRAVNASTLESGMNAAEEYLTSIGAKFKPINSNMEEHLMFASMMSDKRPDNIKNLAPVIYSQQTLSEGFPGVQGMNNTVGTLFGYDVIAAYPYLINFKGSSNAKNILVEAASGWGKTFMVQYLLLGFYADNFNICIMDIKGTEFGTLTDALGGNTISLRNDAPYYINTFVWDTEEITEEGPRAYANYQMRLSKEKMLIMADLRPEEQARGESLIEEFLQTLYALIGADVNNQNTWVRTQKLNPFVVFEYFDKYISHEILRKYGEIAKKTLDRLRMFMSCKGSNSHIFGKPLSYKEILNNRVLRFDFGILEESSDKDEVIFRLHVLDMTIFNDKFVSHKKKNKEWTVKVLEESQIADDYLLKVYTREITLRRAQNQVTFLLGNSIAALYNNPISRPMLDNISIMLMGSIADSSRQYLINDYGIDEAQQKLLQNIQVNFELDRTFLLINRMEKNATTTLVRADVPESVAESSLFKVVDNVV